MKVTLLAYTQTNKQWANYLPPEFIRARAEGYSDPEAVVEYAGRTCYASVDRLAKTPNWIEKRIQAGHESIIEHVSFTFLIEGISRACSHQLVRHRLCSFSQESQRYVGFGYQDIPWVLPDTLHDTNDCLEFLEACDKALISYLKLIASGVKTEDARFLLPNATPTKLVLTANARELLHIFRVRISPMAQWEIRNVCVQMLELARKTAPWIFGRLYQELKERLPALLNNDDTMVTNDLAFITEVDGRPAGDY